MLKESHYAPQICILKSRGFLICKAALYNLKPTKLLKHVQNARLFLIFTDNNIFSSEKDMLGSDLIGEVVLTTRTINAIQCFHASL